MSVKNVFIRVSVFNILYFFVCVTIIYILELSPYLLIPLTAVIIFWARYSYKMNIEALKKEDILKMEGRRGVVIEDINPYGTVKIGNEYWKAYAEKTIPKGGRVKIIRSEGLTLIVGAENDSR